MSPNSVFSLFSIDIKQDKKTLLLLPFTIDQFIEIFDSNDSNGQMSISKHSKFSEPKSSPLKNLSF